MPRIAGVDIPADKKIWISLATSTASGRPTAADPQGGRHRSGQRRAKDLTEEELAKIIGILDKGMLVEGALRRSIQQNIARLRDIGSYRGQPSSPQPARPRPAHALQRPHPQGPAQDRRRQEGREGTR
jgi:small subunit ribosomal protein S13